MSKTICIYEDTGFPNLLPLVYFRPVYDLRCGILTLREKFENIFKGSNVILNCRDYLQETVSEKNPDYSVNVIPDGIESCIFINGRLIIDKDSAEDFLKLGENTALVSDGTVAAINASGDLLKLLKEKITDAVDIDKASLEAMKGVSMKDTNAKLLNYQWDFVGKNGDEIVNDFNALVNRDSETLKGKVYNGVYMVNEKDIFIDEGAKVKPGVVLDAEEGPIYIGKGAKIFPNAVIEGPCFIGENSQIKIGAKIYENTSIGEVCKVGGEVEESIIHSYSNKQHDGFLGHAYLGCWVNLGADTNNSDLKNNYGNVRVTVNGKSIDSGSMFVGLTMGDHSKSSINTMFNTGTVVGVSTNVFGTGFPPKSVPSFGWGGSDSMGTYDLTKAMEVAEKVMNRRKIELTDADKKLFGKIFELTQNERDNFTN